MISVPLHDKCWKVSNAGKMFWSSSSMVTMSHQNLWILKSTSSLNGLLLNSWHMYLVVLATLHLLLRTHMQASEQRWASSRQCHLPFTDCLVVPCGIYCIYAVKPLWRAEWIMTSLTHEGVWSLKPKGPLEVTMMPYENISYKCLIP